MKGKNPRFPVGTRVRIIRSANPDLVGLIGTVVHTSRYSAGFFYRVSFNNGPVSGFTDHTFLGEKLSILLPRSNKG